MVATPIGHLDDLSRRAESVLKSVRIVAAEDTRRTRVLLEHLEHRAPELVSLHAHNETQQSGVLLARLQAGADVALVSDAGTPLLNDPGFTLLEMAQQAGISTVPVPGCSALTTLLSVCPLPSQPFRYVGFLPPKSKARCKLLERALQLEDALIFLESPKRISRTLAELGTLTERRVLVGRELTKRHETLYVGSAGEVAAQLGSQPRGEMIVLVECGEVPALDVAEEKLLRGLLVELPPAQAARLAAAVLGTRKKAMYELALRLSGAGG